MTEPIILKGVKADLHTHGLVNSLTPGWGDSISAFLERRVATLEKADYYLSWKSPSNLLLGVVNFDDSAYEHLVSTRKPAPSRAIYDDYRKIFIATGHPIIHDSWHVYVRGQEIPTEEGHVLVIAADRQIPKRNGSYILTEVLREARDLGAITIADHPLAGGLVKDMLNLVNGSGRFALGEENIRKYAQSLDGIEVWNSNFPGLGEETARLALDLRLLGVYSSDSHDVREALNAYINIPSLDITSPERLKAGIKEGMRKGYGSRMRPRNSRLSGIKHVAAVLYNAARLKAGLVEKVQPSAE